MENKILIRVPKAIHNALRIEAQQQSTSMNQLILAKLSVSLGMLVSSQLVPKKRKPKLRVLRCE